MEVAFLLQAKYAVVTLGKVILAKTFLILLSATVWKAATNGAEADLSPPYILQAYTTVLAPALLKSAQVCVTSPDFPFPTRTVKTIKPCRILL